jgi:predicted small secreted protein
VKASRRSFFAVLLAAALLSACTDNGSTDGGQDATAQPTSTPTVEPSVEPSPSPGTSSPSQTISSPSQTIIPRTVRLCDTKVESANPALRNVRFGRHDTYDRLAFDFCKPAETTLTATVVNQLIEDGSGRKVTLKGKYFIEITLTPADAHTAAGRPTVPSDAVTVAGRNMQQYKLIGDFEGVVTYGVGVMRLEETATALRADPNDPRHVILYFDLGPQSG